MGIAAGMGLAAVCLVVFGTSQKQLQIGVLLGLWGGLIAAFLVFGARRSQAEQSERLAEAEQRANQLHEAQLQVSQLQRQQLEAAEAAQRIGTSQEVELRKLGEVQLSREVAARREADINLELSLRREIERLMTDHIGALRDEVASLRAEVVDKLGGQLRLERIETTRLIGSDLEALQHEIRRLAGGQSDGMTRQVSVSEPLPQLPRETVRAGVDSRAASTAPWPGEHPADIVDAEVIEAEHASAHDEVNPSVTPFEAPGPERPAEPEPPFRYQPPAAGPPVQVRSDPLSWPASAEPARAETAGAETARAETARAEIPSHPRPEPANWPEPASQPEPASWSSPTVVNTDPLTRPTAPSVGDSPLPLYQQSEQVAAFTSSFDPFAGLPRLSPLPDDLELIQDPEPEPEPPAVPSTDERQPGGRRRAPDDADPEANYHGRRRATAEEAELAASNARGRTEPAEGGRRQAAESPAEPGSGRRRAPDDAPDDLFARLPKY
jgi:hypothetical protein